MTQRSQRRKLPIPEGPLSWIPGLVQKDGQGRVVASAPATGGILNGHPISDSTLHKLLTKYGLD